MFARPLQIISCAKPNLFEHPQAYLSSTCVFMLCQTLYQSFIPSDFYTAFSTSSNLGFILADRE